MGTTAIALQGLDQADTQLNAAADAIATGSGDLNVGDLGADMISLTSAQTLYEVNLATLKTADQIEQSLIDLTA